MKYLLALPLLATLLLPSCATVQPARDKLANMSESSYQTLRKNVENVATIGGERLGVALGDRKQKALEITKSLRLLIINDEMSEVDIIQYVIDKYSMHLGLTALELDYIRDGAKAIDAAIGQIKLDISGSLSLREKGLVLALLDGIARGLV